MEIDRNPSPASTLSPAGLTVAEAKMALFGKAERITWNGLNLPEHIVLLAMVSAPQRDVEWLIQRALCYHKLAEITPLGLKLTRLGRLVIAERHGLPVVVGREPARPPLASTGR